jgi:hypothetical protein
MKLLRVGSRKPAFLTNISEQGGLFCVYQKIKLMNDSRCRGHNGSVSISVRSAYKYNRKM